MSKLRVVEMPTTRLSAQSCRIVPLALFATLALLALTNCTPAGHQSGVSPAIVDMQPRRLEEGRESEQTPLPSQESVDWTWVSSPGEYVTLDQVDAYFPVSKANVAKLDFMLLFRMADLNVGSRRLR